MRTFEHGRFCWHDLATPDPEAAMRFYGALFGWSAEQHPTGEDCAYTIFSDGETQVAGARIPGPEHGNIPSHWTCCVAVDDVDDAARRATETGAQLCHGPVDVHDLGRVATLLDPTGAAVALWTEHRRADTLASPPRPGRFCWDELATRDLPAARRFYTGLLGWGTREREMPGGEPYTVFTRGDEMCAGALGMSEEWGDVPPHWMPYVMVSNCDETARAAGRLGGSVCVPPTDIPSIGRITVLQDPFGATLSAITFTEKT